MPRRWRGENSKAAEARARQQEMKAKENEAKKQQELEQYWQDDDKHVLKKLQRREERERKKQILQERKMATQQLLEKEEKELAALNRGFSTAVKKTRAAIEEERQKEMLERQKLEERNRLKMLHVIVPEEEIEENVNRLQIDGEEARTVEEAIQVLSAAVTPVVDLHPERRIRQAYNAFEEEYLPRLKAENPNLRLSQLKQLIKKEWQKSPKNPMNYMAL
ncbi:unnamed protein product [Soboliphyme baturini]|uniref:Coiled-coil domain-containing protein 124 n=1 Tax=Soboliphyme baturini TaxID=241478 RepID=A0A183IH45_9BILA|nr:unnamed protein product [Soboliphyme baturini]